jgi:hypothetical protein
MATCPVCKTSSRQDGTAFSVTRVLIAKPLGTWSVSGTQMKTVASEYKKLSCRCGWSILGYIDENLNFVGAPDTQTFPTPADPDPDPDPEPR